MDIKPYVQQLYENESHTNALTDDGARTLLTWGERQLNVVAAYNPDEAQMEQVARQLSRVLRAVNRVIELKAGLTDDQLVERLLTLAEQAMALQSLGKGKGPQT